MCRTKKGNRKIAKVVALQRDVFGRHGFKRLDKDGEVTEQSYNFAWNELQ